MTTNILISGFGGQGVLFTGKFLAYEGLVEEKEVTWLPSYGPEMRGGTCNCAVIISDDPIGSPLVTAPDVLIAMNTPSVDKFEGAVAPGGMMFYDSSMIDQKISREHIKAFGVPATQMAADAGFPTLANMIVLGKLLKETGMFAPETIDKTLEKVVSARKRDLLELNKTAIKMGMEL
ncbi:MAG: 2-oxoacid:acceptor oxidoreductase family protein [Clostridiales bacterium]|nr:2-oxoacid:acceptor oxidoreductase family protein [Clostridiales bacterium]